MVHKRRVLAAAALLAVLAAVLSICIGAVTVPPEELLAALTGQGSGTHRAIILYVRMPRTAGCWFSLNPAPSAMKTESTEPATFGP